MSETSDATAAATDGCPHLAEIRPVRPYSMVCLACRAEGDVSADLWLCLSCGWVACGGGVPDGHARAHYEETDHPVCVRLGNGARRPWCHVHPPDPPLI